MSDENFNPENDAYLMKLKEIRNKQTELIKIEKIVSELKEIEFKKNPIDKFKVAALILLLLVIVMAILIVIKITDYNISDNQRKQANTSIVEEQTTPLDTSIYIFYISNNVGRNNYFDLKYEQVLKLKELMPEKNVYKVKFVSEKNGSKEQFFTDKDLLVKTLIDEIKSGGDMRMRTFLNFAYDLKENCGSEKQRILMFFGKLPNDDSFQLIEDSLPDDCSNMSVLYFVPKNYDTDLSLNQFLSNLRINYRNINYEVVK